MKVKNYVFSGLIALFMLFGLMMPQAAQARDIVLNDAATLAMYPATVTATTCETATVQVKVSDVVDLTAYHLEVTYDREKVQVISVVNGGFLTAPSEGGLYEPTNTNDVPSDPTGRILFGMAQQGTNGDPNPKSGSGNLITITLKALVPSGTTTLAIDGTNSMLVDWPDVQAVPFSVTSGTTVTLMGCAPVAQAQTVTTAEDTAKAITLVATDPDGDALTYGIVAGPTHGTLSGTAPNLTYTPAANYHGTDTFTYKANDGLADSNVATVTITVTGVNDAPVLAEIGPKTVANSGTLSFTPSAADVDGDPLTWSLGTGAPAGAAIDPTTGAFSWTPGTSTTPGAYSVTICVSDGTLEDCETVTITVTDGVSPVLVSVNPPRGNVYLAGGETFKLIVKASDDNLRELEIDHSMASTIPEFSVYASETDPYGGDGDDFAALGVSVTYNATTQTWVIDFGATITNTFIANPNGITFYMVLEDEAGNTWGTMYGTTPENTFAYKLIRDDIAPEMEEVTPPEGNVYLAAGENFVLTVDAKDTNLYSLEIDHSMEGSLPEFTIYADAANPYGSAEAKAAFEAQGVTVTYDAVEQVWTIDFGSTVTNMFIANPSGITFYMVLEDMAGNSWGTMYGTTPENTYVYHIVRDDVAPVLVSVNPPRGNVYLAGGETFKLIVKASDDNLRELEIDHSMASTIPEFSVYASETDPYGGDGDDFAALGVSVTYNATTQTWVIDFGATITNTFIANPNGITFYMVLEDEAGNKWGTMYGTTPENTFAYKLIRDDVAPEMEEVTPPEGNVYLAAGENFVLTVDAKDTNLYSLEIDHSMEGSLPEFTIYADAANPYGSAEAKTAFEAQGVTVTYDAVEQVWTIDFGTTVTNMFIANPSGITFYMVLEDMAGNSWGTMYGTTPENTYVYHIVRDDVAPVLVSVTPPHNSTILLGIGDTFKLTIQASDDNLRELEIDHSMASTIPEFSVYASESDPYGGDGAQFATAGVTVTYTEATQTWVIDFGTNVSTMIANNNGITFYMVLEDMAGNKWGSMSPTTPANTFKYTVNQDLVAPTISEMVANGAGTFDDVTAVDTTFTVDQGYTVASISITMSEPVTVTAGTEVTLAGVPYGLVTVSADGLTLTVTPYAGNEVASLIGTFNFVIPAGSVKDLAGNALSTLGATLVVNNVAPVAVDDAYIVAEDGVLSVAARGVLTNDTDFDPTILTAVKVSDPANGTLTLNADGSFTYTPAANYHGTDTFTYKANDGLADSNVATVTITVTGVNDAPVAVNDTYSTSFETTLTVALPGVLDNDTDADGDTLTAALVTGVNNGSLTLNENGSFTYTPNANFNGVDTFTYKANDGTTDSNVATVTITVTAWVNTPPVAVADTYETDQGVELVVAAPGVLSNDYDIDDDVLTATLKTNVTKGTLVLLEDGSFSYKPNAGFCGTDSFVYTLVSYPRITDAGWTADATVTITVYCDAIISSEDLDGPFYVGNQQEFHVRLQNPAPGHTYGSLAASVFVDDITTADFTSVELKHPINGAWLPLTPVVDGSGLRLDVGPIASFPLTSGFDQTLTFRITFNTAGDYPVTGTLYDGVILPAKAIASYSDTMVVAGLEAQDFGYMYTSGVMGVTAGFGNVNFDLSQAASIKVELFSGSAGAYQLMQTNTAIDPDLMAAWTQFSTPFDIFGSFDYAADGYWANVRETEYGQTAIPTRVLATVTLPGGITLTAENTILTGDRGYIIDTLIEEIVSAPEYDYDPPYIPVGESEFDLSSLTYTGTYTAPQVLAGAPMNDMARLLGALYRQAGSSITSIVYNGTTYTWDTTGTLVGSNWEDASGKTLVSQVTADFQAAVAGGTWDPNAGFVMTVHDDYEHSATVTFKLVILNTLDAEIASAPAYAYTPAYTYVGSYAFVDATNVYTVTYDDTAFAPGAMNDMARYLGALNRQAGATVASISYKGTTYTWYVPAGQTELQGSNWRDASGTTLVSVITAEALAGQIDPAVGITLTLSDVFHTETVIFRFVINDTIAPTIAGMVANGAGTYGDVAAVGTTFTVDQGYTVASITITMSEPVTVTAGTEVTLAGVPYGLVTVSADGLTLTVTPYAGNEVASLIGTFNFVIPAGSVKDLAGNALTTLEATLVVNNVAPVAVDDNYTVAEGGVLTVAARGVLTNDTDFDPTILTAVKVSNPVNGTLTLNADGSFTYTPAANYHGTDTFTYKANDGLADSNVATVTITVTAVNDAPVAQDQTVTTAEDTAKAITLAATDADGDTLTYAIVAGPTHGTLSGTAPNLTYTPAANYNGPDSFTFKANDGTIDSNVATVTITVTPVNDAPVAQDQSVTTAEDTAKAITLVATDADGDTLTYAIVAGPSHGTLSGTAPNLTYTPAANYNGPDSFTFKANDGTIDSNVATVTITVTPVNDAPVAQDQSVTTAEDTAKAITLAATDADGDTLTYAIVAGPSHGTLSGTAPNLTYTPAANYNGPDSFTFKANDGATDSNVATVTITVTAVNDAPVAQDQSVTTAEDTAKAITLVATDADGDTLTYAIVAGPSHGTLSGTAPNLTYTPAANYNGPDSFTFKANDGATDSNVATVTITVTAVNDAPVAQDQSVTTAEDTAKAITLAATDADGDTLTYAIVAGPSHGTLSGTAPNLTYTPAANYNGPDSFTFKANDGATDSNVATVTITVTAVNDAPVAQDQSVTTAEDTAKAITLAATDADGDTLTYTIVAGPSHGTLSGTAPNLTYTPAANYNGPDSFTFKANDGTVDSNTATVTITVTPVNDAPVAEAQSVTTAEDTAKAITLVAADADGDTLTYAIVAQPAHGSVTLVGNVATYTPAANYNGPDSFTFKANDGTVDSNTATVTITVTPVNDAPVAEAQSVTTAEDTAKAITLVATDADGDTLTYAIVAQPAHGSVTLVGNVATYTPAANYNGPDSFTFKANDGTIDSNVATVTITVTPVNDAPVAVDDAYTMNEKDTLTVAAPGVLANDTDVDGDTLTAILVDGVQHGVLTLNADGSFTYTPDEYFNGVDSFTYKAKDAALESDLAVVTITVTPVNDWPIANDDEYETMAGITLDVAAPGVLANDILLDPDETVTLQILVQPTHGTLTLNNDGSFTYIPNPGFMGTDTFRYMVLSVRGKGEWSDDALVTIVVKPYVGLFLPIIWR